MAGKILYAGEMFQAMIAKLDQSIAALNAVNTAVSQGVTSLNVKPGSDKVMTFAHGVKTRNTGGTTIGKVVDFRSSCNGVVSVTVRVKTTENLFGSLFYCINNGAFVNAYLSFSPANTWIEKTFNIPVMVGDIISLGLAQDKASGPTLSLDDNTRISYSVVNLVTEGAFNLV